MGEKKNKKPGLFVTLAESRFRDLMWERICYSRRSVLLLNTVFMQSQGIFDSFLNSFDFFFLKRQQNFITTTATIIKLTKTNTSTSYPQMHTLCHEYLLFLVMGLLIDYCSNKYIDIFPCCSIRTLFPKDCVVGLRWVARIFFFLGRPASCFPGVINNVY